MRIIVSIVCWSVMSLLSVPWAVNAQEPAPHLVLEELMFDAGEVKEGSRVSHDFIIVNKGKATLQIHKVSPG